MVVIKAELVSVSKAGPLSSIDSNMLCTFAETVEKEMTFSFNKTSIKWQAAREELREAIVRDADCQTDIQYLCKEGALDVF